MDRIKRHSAEIMAQYKSEFGTDFSDNKKALEQVSTIRSKGLKNEIAGYITKSIKREIRIQKEKAEREKQFDERMSEKSAESDPETAHAEPLEEQQAAAEPGTGKEPDSKTDAAPPAAEPGPAGTEPPAAPGTDADPKGADQTAQT